MRNIFVEGNRGYCAAYPENTRISFEAAMAFGVDGFELDIWLSSDKVPVHMYCAETDGDVVFCLGRDGVLITANDPVPLMKALGRPMSKVRDVDE